MNATSGMTRVRRRLGVLSLAGIAWLAPGAQAQEQGPVEEIVITGSRISAPNMSSTSPVQVVSDTEIKHLGKTDMVDILNTLPQVFQNSATDFSNTSNSLSTPGGLTTVNLRGLGPQRTLVLVDGRRLGTADANTGNPNPAPNLDQIPVALIERVDVVTGGASAVYGSDAVAGVVNFIMRKDFEGVQIDAQYGFNQHENDNGFMQGLAGDAGLTVADGGSTDGENMSVSVIGGTNIADGRGNFTAYLTFREADPITGADRDFAGCQLFTELPDSSFCGGSSNSNFFRPVTSQTPYTVVGDQFLPWPADGSSPPASFNSNRFVNMSRDDTRYMAGFMAHVTMNDYAEPYAEFGFMNDKTEVVIAPSGLFRGSNPLTADTQYLVNCSNPLLSDQQRAILCTPEQVAADLANPGSTSVSVEIGRRNIEGGGRVAEFEHTNYRGVLGVRGDLGPAWSYDAYGQYYYSTLYNSNSNYLNFQSIANGLQVTGTRDNPVCVSGGACVPYNIFTEGGVTEAQLNYLYTPGTAYGTVTQQVVHADVTGDLGEYGLTVPLAQQGISVNVGLERRTEDLTFDPDSAELSGLLAGFSGASVPIDNGYSVEEAFGEIRVPLVQERTGIYDLVVDAGYRYSDYSTSAGTTDAWKVQLQYAPIPDLRFRTSFQHAIRAPNIIELFSPLNYGQQSFLGVDPCAPQDGEAATATLEECIRTGVTPAQYGDGLATNTIPQCVSNQCGQVIGGNTELDSEQADTWSLGVTISPSALPDLTASVDYYKIELEDAIGTMPGAFLFTQCMASGDPTFCSQIRRTSLGALTGSSVASGGYILQTAINTGEARLSGVDVQAAYTINLGDSGHSLLATLNGAWLEEAIATPAPGLSYDCAGLFGTICQTVNPTWRHNLRLTWMSPWEVDVSLQWRHIGGTKLDQNDSDPDLQFALWGEFDEFNAELPDMNYLDLSAIWEIDEKFTLRAGATNVLDKDPPVVGTEISGTGSANTYPTFDTLGRQIFLSATAKF